VSVSFRCTDVAAYVGTCVAIDIGTSNIFIRNLTCEKIYEGAVFQFGPMGVHKCPWNNQIPFPRVEDQFAHEITISDLYTNSVTNTGFASYFVGHDVRNVSYNNVYIVGGQFLKNDLWTAKGCKYDEYPYTYVPAYFTDIYFRNYSGNLGQPAPSCWDYRCLGNWL
jgi:hypothetical protein